MQPNSYHWRDGWYFCREDDGTVVVQGHDPARVTPIVLRIPPEEWASIVAHVSARGGTAAAYAAAEQLHAGHLAAREG